jgi:Ca2+-binding RTX toxin-like protein
MIWNPGEGNDILEGGDGTDTAEVNGGNGTETFTITANGSRVRFDRLTPAPFNLDIGTTENLVVHANGGDDVITAGNGLANLIHLTLDGGTGNDTITGGDGNDLLLGGDGNDAITGGRGNDTAQLGAGDDRFVWNPGDGSDVVDGQDGYDTLHFNGANIAETITISAAKAGHVSFERNVAAIDMDLANIERIEFVALGGADTIAVGDLSKTDVKLIALDLAATPGSGMGDGLADTVIVDGTSAANHITVVNAGTGVAVEGLSAEITIDGVEAANDTVAIKSLGGNDVIDASNVQIKVIVDGGTGNDTITGGANSDMLIGGDGSDTITGGHGNDTAFLGSGNDTFVWNPGDGSDIVEGQDGTDTLLFNGANINEIFEVSANGQRVRLSRDVGNVVMDINDVEHVALTALGGADTVVVDDLTGTDVTQVAIGLAATPGSGQGDTQTDTVIVNGGNSSGDSIKVVSSGSSIVVNGLAAQVTIAGAEAGKDALTINGLGGNDTIDASKLHADQLTLTLNAGDGDDTVIGSAGNDLVNGGRGNDVARLGAGDDTFVWNPGDGSDTIEGQAGNDTLVFNGSNIGEKIDISANGGRVRLFRDVAAITMDLNDTETLDVNTLGGADTITVGDLTKTDVTKVNIDLGANGAPDGSADTIIINATNAEDVITLVNNNGVITVSGLAEEVNISHFDANDRIVINGLGGDDVIQASGLTGILLTESGGDGADVLIGGNGDDTILGGAGDDVLIGGPGNDILDGGTGNNILIQSANFAPATVGDAASVALLSQFMAASFVPAGGPVGTPIVEAATQQQPLLAQPHA